MIHYPSINIVSIKLSRKSLSLSHSFPLSLFLLYISISLLLHLPCFRFFKRNFATREMHARFSTNNSHAPWSKFGRISWTCLLTANSNHKTLVDLCDLNERQVSLRSSRGERRFFLEWFEQLLVMPLSTKEMLADFMPVDRARVKSTSRVLWFAVYFDDYHRRILTGSSGKVEGNLWGWIRTMV